MVFCKPIRIETNSKIMLRVENGTEWVLFFSDDLTGDLEI